MIATSSSCMIWIAVIVYLVSTARAMYSLWPARSAPADSVHSDDRGLNWVIPLGIVAWLAHSTYAVSLAFSVEATGLNLNLSVASMSALVSAILVGTFLLLCQFMTLSRLAVIVFPLSLFALLFSYFWHMDSGQTLVISRSTSLSLKLHVLTSILAYTFITLSAIQALVYRFQASQFKQRNRAHILSALPPLETMESLIFRLLFIGFALLTITLSTGSVFSQVLFGVPLEITHHTVLAFLAWILCVRVLAVRFRSGMSGKQATPWVIAIFLCLQLGYFVSKIILETLN